MKKVVIVACGRSPFGKIGGRLSRTRPEDFCAQVVKGVLAQVPAAGGEIIEDFVLGCAYPEGVQGLNMAKNVAALAGLPSTVAAQTINRYCSSGLQAIATAANAIAMGQCRVALAGGVESMSMIPMNGARNLPNPDLFVSMPEYYSAMGITAENVANRYGVTREEMDRFAMDSHRKAHEAVLEGKTQEEIIPVQAVEADDGTQAGIKRVPFEMDDGIRPQTTMESLAKLRTVFRDKGTVTAGNASQMTDGAAAALLMEESCAKELGLKPLARYITFAVAGVDPDVMGIGPVKAIPKALKNAGMNLEGIDLIELNEAFASQAIACVNELDLNPELVNVNGGAIALGHPLGCTGGALTVKIIRELQRRGGGHGMVSMCIGGGQGAAGIFEIYPA